MSTAPDSSTPVDLRSDTVTTPSPPMLQAVLTAPTGDDVMGEDPTVQYLEQQVAELFQKEKGLFFPTGTMANIAAIMAHCNTRASEVILGAHSHIHLWEGGNTANLAGVSTTQLLEDPWTAQIDPQAIRDAVRHDQDDHFPHTQLLCIENTHNMLGGIALSPQYLQQQGKLAQELGLALHVDGARLWNACAFHQVSPGTMTQHATTVSVCLSKGLGAPLGSVLVGSHERIRLAQRARKRLGGGMRQVGVVASMGLYALEHNLSRIHQDHQRAQILETELQREGFYLPRPVQTNILYFGLPVDSVVSKSDFCSILDHKYNVKLTGGYSTGGNLFRAVTHLNIDDVGIQRAAEAMVRVVKGL